MYQKVQNIPLKYSASSLNNNLSCFFEHSEKYHLAVIHKSLVNFITYSLPHGVSAREITCKAISGSASTFQPLILQAKWVTLYSKTLFVIVSQRGLQVFDSKGIVLLHWHSFITPEDDYSQDVYGLGIATIGNLLCVGSSAGCLLIFRVTPDNGEITDFERLEGHHAPISYLCSNSEMLVSADETGTICVWQENKSLVKTHFFHGNGSACTSMKIWNHLLIAGFANGQLKVFNIDCRVLICDVDAHARSITSIDIANDCGLVISASEDSYIRVWQLKIETIPVISLKFSKNILDCPLNGAQFIGMSGSKFCITGYDQHEILCYEM